MVTTSIFIPSFNTRELSVQCIRSIEENPPTAPYEIILMDNDSRDGTADEVSRLFPQVRVMRNEGNFGVGKACNLAAQIAQGKYFLLLNNDAKPHPGAIDGLVEWLESHPKTGIVTPELIGEEGQLLQMSWGWFPILHGEVIQQFFSPSAVQKSPLRQRWVRFLQRRSRRVPWACCACALIRREAYEQIGGFDEDFKLYFEDSDLCLRCAKNGWQIDFAADIKAVHHLSKATRSSTSIFSLIYLQSHITFYRKHGPFWALWLLKGFLYLKGLRLSGTGDYGAAYLQVVLGKHEISLPKGA